MSISEAVLFAASNSRASMQTAAMIRGAGLPIEIVFLDSVKARQIVATGKHFKITAVPTLVVVYADGNLQLFIGAPKIAQWLSQITSSSAGKEGEGRVDPDARVRKRPLATGASTRARVEEVPDEPEDSETEEVVEPPKKKIKAKKKKKTPPVSFEPEDTEMIQAPDDPTPKGSRMTDIVNMAAKMEQDRKNTLPYREEDLLPRNFKE